MSEQGAVDDPGTPRRRVTLGKRTIPGYRWRVRWSDDETAALVWGYGHVNIEVLAGRIGRGCAAVHSKARKMGLLGAGLQGRFTLLYLVRWLGVDYNTIHSTVRRHGIHLSMKKSAGPSLHGKNRRYYALANRYAITEEQTARIIRGLIADGRVRASTAHLRRCLATLCVDEEVSR